MAANSTAKSSAETKGWLTRSEASDLLGVSHGTLINWESRGFLHPKLSPRGTFAKQVIVYNPAELAVMPTKKRAALATSAVDELAARVFEMLEAGKGMREIVILARLSLEKVEAIREGWLDAGGSDLVLTKAAWAAIERCVGKFSTVAELVERIDFLLGTKIEIDVPEDHPVAVANEDQIENGIVAALESVGA